MTYERGTTNVHTRADEALADGRGVCQDFAHVLIGLCRAHGVPARYVSGYLFDPQGNGNGDSAASHAWVDVYDEGRGWRSLDPTHDTEQTERYVRVGVGRDYADVPPTRGVYRGTAVGGARGRGSHPGARMIVDPDIERYALAHTTAPLPAIAALREETETMPRPQLAGGRIEVRLLEALVVATRATRVLEIGTFTGVGALSIASRLPEGGKVVTLEGDEEVAAIARRHIDDSPWRDRIELVLGDARETVLPVDGPLDLVFIDAWKRDYIHYYEVVLPKLADHGVIVADNVLWGGTVLDPGAEGEAAAVRAFSDHVHADERVDNTVLPVADGLLLAWKR